MFDFAALLKNPKLLEGMIGSMIRLIPPDKWAMVAKELHAIGTLIADAKTQLDRIEAGSAETRELATFHDSLLRNMRENGPAFAERDFYCPPDRQTIGGIPIADIRPGIMESDAGVTGEKFREQINGGSGSGSGSGEHHRSN